MTSIRENIGGPNAIQGVLHEPGEANGNGVVLARASIVIPSFCCACNAHTANSVSRNAVPLNIGLRRVRIIFLARYPAIPLAIAAPGMTFGDVRKRGVHALTAAPALRRAIRSGQKLKRAWKLTVRPPRAAVS